MPLGCIRPNRNLKQIFLFHKVLLRLARWAGDKLMVVVLFVIGQIFKRGMALQAENDLTV